MGARLHMGKKVLIGVAVLVVLGSMSSGRAQDYPEKPIRMIVPASAGGPTDTIARTVAQHMSVTLAQNVIIENIGGASGTLGTTRVARATPDGYTIGIGGWNHYVVNGAVYSLPYDLLKDFEPISLVASGPLLIISRKSIPANDLTDLIAWLKANPGASFGTGGVASPPHVSGLSFESMIGARFQFIPYRGSAPAMQNLIAGQIDLMIDQSMSTLPQVRNQTIKVYAVTAKTRLSAAPEVPTVDEAGLPGLYASVWHGVWAPGTTPKAIVTKLNAALVDALGDAAVRQRLSDLGQEIFPREQQTPEALRAFHKAEIDRWWPIIKAAGLKPE
jgi:tripartite-type tricarboxylate transporter receptor subunit TctC